MSIPEKIQHEKIQIIELEMMDPVKYYPLTMISGCTIRGLLYPFTLIKTRMQMQTGKEIYTGTFNALTSILRNEGVSGLYRGFIISNLLIFPQVCYIAVYEQMRTLLGRYTHLTNSKLKAALGGFSASVASQTLIVPIDIISQHLMMSGSNERRLVKQMDHFHLRKQSSSRFGCTISVIRAIRLRYGIRGFYKGYFASLALYAPNSGMWWLFYDTYCGKSCS